MFLCMYVYRALEIGCFVGGFWALESKSKKPDSSFARRGYWKQFSYIFCGQTTRVDWCMFHGAEAAWFDDRKLSTVSFVHSELFFFHPGGKMPNNKFQSLIVEQGSKRWTMEATGAEICCTDDRSKRTRQVGTCWMVRDEAVGRLIR